MSEPAVPCDSHNHGEFCRADDNCFTLHDGVGDVGDASDGQSAGRRGAAVVEEYAKTDPALVTFEPRGITPEDTVVFVLGCVPFVYAGIEFWTRIANGDSFGTGRDSVVIKPLGQQYEGNKRVLGQGAMIAARILFAIAGASALLVVVGVFDVLS